MKAEGEEDDSKRYSLYSMSARMFRAEEPRLDDANALVAYSLPILDAPERF